MQIQYYNELFDPKFYAEFEFVVEILSPPTHFEKKNDLKKLRGRISKIFTSSNQK